MASIATSATGFEATHRARPTLSSGTRCGHERPYQETTQALSERAQSLQDVFTRAIWVQWMVENGSLTVSPDETALHLRAGIVEFRHGLRG
jgi:hypothetical protein